MTRSRKLLTSGVWCLVIGAMCFFAGLQLPDLSGAFGLAILLGLVAAGLGLAALITGAIGVRQPDSPKHTPDLGAVVGGLAVAGAGLAGSAVSLLAAAGPAIAPWGRPLRIGGLLVQADLRPGAGWAAGPEPDVSDMSEATRHALATLWHHDAQKEHASVPAFSRVAWLLTGLGAPAELLVRTHEAAIQEIDHARRCFALAAGYAGAPQSAEPIPELLASGLGVTGDPLLVVALESLRDGCLIEDFNADVAARACTRASDPAARALVERIARDERAHAELAWSVVAWCLAVGGEPVRQALADAIASLPTAGPQAHADDETSLIAAADPQALIAHGRVPAGEWAAIYARRLDLTRTRARALLSEQRAAA